jgi:hypothetical protein
MLAALLLTQVMVETLDTRPQSEFPATAFRCSFMGGESADGAPAQFDLYGVVPAAPQRRRPNDAFPLMLGSDTGSPLAGPASGNPGTASEWFRDILVSRRVGSALYVIHLKLRREGRSLAYMTVYDSNWAASLPGGVREPFRYDSVGLCTADFSYGGQPS